jgi:hypothetical protein
MWSKPVERFPNCFFFYSWGGTFGTAATTGLWYQPRMISDDDCGEIGGMNIGRGIRNSRRKPAPAPLCQPQSQRLTAWAMARSLQLLHGHLQTDLAKLMWVLGIFFYEESFWKRFWKISVRWNLVDAFSMFAVATHNALDTFLFCSGPPPSTVRRRNHGTQNRDEFAQWVSSKIRFVVVRSVNVLLFPLAGDGGLKSAQYFAQPLLSR